MIRPTPNNSYKTKKIYTEENPSFPAQMWSVLLNDFWKYTLIFA